LSDHFAIVVVLIGGVEMIKELGYPALLE